MNTIKPTPTYYVRHPDDTYSVADPQPTIQPVKQEPVALAIQAQKSADYWMNHYDRKSKSDMEVLHRHVLQEFKAIRAEEQEKFRKIAEAVLGWVYAGDRDKPFNDADFVGEMVRIRLTGLTLLAEIVRPGCREEARKKFTEETAAAIRGLK